MQIGAVWEMLSTEVVGLSDNLSSYEARGIVLSAVVGNYAPVRLAFAWSRAESVPLILGQTNFFLAFNVCFFRAQNIFEVESRGR